MCGPILGALGGLLGLVSSRKMSAPSAQPVSASPSAVDVTSGNDAIESAKAAKQKAAAAAGFQSTINTSSSGDQSTATTKKKTLLG